MSYDDTFWDFIFSTQRIMYWIDDANCIAGVVFYSNMIN